MKNINITQIVITTLIATVIATLFAQATVMQELNNNRQFKVVDIKKISEASMLRLKESIKDKIENGDTEIKPEVITMLAQAEAKKMFEYIAVQSKGKDIIIPKSLALFTPDGYEITEEIADLLGLEGVSNDSFSERMNAASKKANINDAI